MPACVRRNWATRTTVTWRYCRRVAIEPSACLVNAPLPLTPITRAHALRASSTSFHYLGGRQRGAGVATDGGRRGGAGGRWRRRTALPPALSLPPSLPHCPHLCHSPTRSRTCGVAICAYLPPSSHGSRYHSLPRRLTSPILAFLYLPPTACTAYTHLLLFIYTFYTLSPASPAALAFPTSRLRSLPHLPTPLQPHALRLPLPTSLSALHLPTYPSASRVWDRLGLVR